MKNGPRQSRKRERFNMYRKEVRRPEGAVLRSKTTECTGKKAGRRRRCLRSKHTEPEGYERARPILNYLAITVILKSNGAATLRSGNIARHPRLDPGSPQSCNKDYGIPESALNLIQGQAQDDDADVCGLFSVTAPYYVCDADMTRLCKLDCYVALDTYSCSSNGPHSITEKMEKKLVGEIVGGGPLPPPLGPA